MKFIKKSPVTLELEKIEKEEKWLEQRALSRTEPGWKEALTARIPPKMSENLQKAFCMAFRTIFEKGNLLIEKTYRRDELEKDFKVRDFSLDLKESRKEYKKLRIEAARRNLKNQAVSAAEGLGLGLLGVGLPDIAIFTAMLLRGVYETALYFGFSYDTPEERFFILCLLEASVSRGEQWAENNARVDRLIYTLVQKKELTVFAVNRNMDETAEVSLDFEGFGELTLAEHMVLNNDDMKAVNSPENPENVVPKKGTGVKDGVVILEPHSYNIVRFYTK